MATEANRAEIKTLMESATDSSGNIDPGKAAKALRDAGYSKLADQVASRR